LVNTVQQHILNMLQLRFSITIWVIDTVINDPELIGLRIDIHTSHNTNAFDDPVRIPAILAPHQFDFVGIILVNHGVIKNQKSIWCLDNLLVDILPDCSGANFITCKIPIRHIVTKLVGVFRIVCERVIGLAHQQVLTVI